MSEQLQPRLPIRVVAPLRAIAERLTARRRGLTAMRRELMTR